MKTLWIMLTAAVVLSARVPSYAGVVLPTDTPEETASASPSETPTPADTVTPTTTATEEPTTTEEPSATPTETATTVPTATATNPPVLAMPDTRDTNDADPGDGVCADSRGNCTLRAAVDETNANPGRDVIIAAAGRYALSNSLEIRDDLQILGAGAENTRWRGSKRGTAFVIAPGAVVELADVYLAGGTGDAGGNIRNAGTLTLRRSVITKGLGNQGGGIYNTGVLHVEDTLLYGNRNNPPPGLRGPVTGDVFVSIGASLANLGTANLERVSIVRGQARRGCGGGIYNGEGAVLTATNVGVIRNRARQGQAGGICNVNGDLTCINCTIARNQANNRVGGLLNLGGTIRLGNTMLDENMQSNRDRTRPRQENCAGDRVLSLGHNLDNGHSCQLDGPGDLNDLNPWITSPLRFSPVVVASSINPESPAIDGGDNALCPPDDTRGVSRPLDGDGDGHAHCDIGVIEFRLDNFRP